MRFRCEVNILNRLLAHANVRKADRAAFSHVSIGRKPGHKDGPIFLMLCTAKNRNGDKYTLYKNVENIFSKFLREGKATIRLSEPTIDIAFSKAEPSQLNVFLKLARLAHEGKDFPDKALSTLAPVSLKQVEKPITSLVISKPSEYPMSMPKSLEKLTVNSCLLRRVSLQIVSLTRLRELDLGSNQIATLPDSFAELTSLQTLCLQCNKLVSFPNVLLTGKMNATLSNLNLKENEIDRLPPDIIKLKFLQRLNLCDNQLRLLPENVGRMASLYTILVSNNKLDFLPASLLARTYSIVDFSENPFLGQIPQARIESSASFSFPTLAECAGKIIVQSRIYYTEEDLDFISINYLKTAHYCLCGKVCFESSKCSLLRKALSSTQRDVNSKNLPFLIYYCSPKCLDKFR